MAQNEIQGRTVLHQIIEVVADARMHTLRTISLEDARVRAERNHETLMQALAGSRAEVIELRVRHRVCTRHLLDVERQLAELRVHQKDDRRR